MVATFAQPWIPHPLVRRRRRSTRSTGRAATVVSEESAVMCEWDTVCFIFKRTSGKSEYHHMEP